MSKQGRKKERKNDAISASAQPGGVFFLSFFCICVSLAQHERKNLVTTPSDVCQDPHGTKKKTKNRRMKLFVPSGYLHSAALRPPAGVAK